MMTKEESMPKMSIGSQLASKRLRYNSAEANGEAQGKWYVNTNDLLFEGEVLRP
jgi:hypothetical protein